MGHCAILLPLFKGVGPSIQVDQNSGGSLSQVVQASDLGLHQPGHNLTGHVLFFWASPTGRCFAMAWGERDMTAALTQGRRK